MYFFVFIFAEQNNQQNVKFTNVNVMTTFYTSFFLYEDGSRSYLRRPVNEIDMLSELVKSDLERHLFERCELKIEIDNFKDDE